MLLTSLLVPSLVVAFGATPLEAKKYTSPQGETLLYRQFTPAELDPSKKYPLVVILHGAGERGDDNTKQLVWFWHESKPSLLTHPEFLAAKAFAIVPQVPAGKLWVEANWSKGEFVMKEATPSMRMTLELIDSMVKDQPIDKDRIYIMGMSMGGYGTFDAVSRRPELFAAAIPICGGGDTSKAREIAKVPFWVFHGEKDKVVPVTGSRKMVEAMKAAGGSPKYTEYPGVGHNSWSPAFAEKEFWSWLFSQKRSGK